MASSSDVVLGLANTNKKIGGGITVQKYPRTKAGMRKRRMAADVGLNKQFNPHNGEVHTKRYRDEQRRLGLRRKRG